MNGAYASFEENQKGSITAGKLADLVVLGHDPLRVDPMSLIEVPIERTIVGGRWVYESWFQETACPRARLSEVVMFTEPRP